MKEFTIVVDSNCDLPPEYIKENGIEVMPIPFDLDGSAHNLGYWQTISSKEYYDALRNGGVSKTSQINPETFVTTFLEYAKENRDALFIILSSELSSTFNNAVIALKEIKKSYPDCGIHLVNSISATVGHGLLAMKAVEKREQGLSAGETAALLEEKKHNCLGFFTVDDLMYLHRGGRLSKVSAVAGSILGFKPVLNLAPDGTLSLKEKVRGREAAMKLMASQLERSIKPGRTLENVMITHSDCQEDAQKFAEIIESAFDVKQITVMMMGPVIGAHLGPGAVTLIFEADLTREEYEKKFYSGK